MRSLSSSISVSCQVDGWPGGVSRTLAGLRAFFPHPPAEDRRGVAPPPAPSYSDGGGRGLGRPEPPVEDPREFGRRLPGGAACRPPAPARATAAGSRPTLAGRPDILRAVSRPTRGSPP